jgi:cystathionine beta-lyase
VRELDANRHLLSRLLSEELPDARLVEPHSTYLAWLDLRGLGLGDDPAAELVQRARVALSAGPTFGAGGEGHARLNYGTSPEIIREAVGRIAASVG